MRRFSLGVASRNRAALCPGCLLVVAGLAPAPIRAQPIGFETLPDGSATVDQQEISDQYAVYGVTFTLLDRVTGLPTGAPRIAKAGPPRTAFNGCSAVDTPLPHLDLGASFLTDGSELGVEGDLLIEYATPVAQASGVILDIDCRDAGGPPCEQWTVTAFDASGLELQTVVLDGPPGSPNPECMEPEAGPGDAEGFGWTLATATPEIHSILLRYTGIATEVGLAFDNFSVAGPPAPLQAEVVAPADTVCEGESLSLTAIVSGGVPPYAFRWQQEVSPSEWVDLGTDYVQEVQPSVTSRYRVIVSDTVVNEATSEPVEVAIEESDPLCAASLLVSNYLNDRVVRYSFRSRLPSEFVSSGSGGLDGTSKAVCGPDGNLYVASQVNHRVLRYDGQTGAFTDIFVPAGSGGLNIPTGMDFGPDGNLYVASYQNNSVLRYDGHDGAFIDAFVPAGSGLAGPTGLVFGPDANLYVCSVNGDKVLRFEGATGTPLGDFVPSGSGGLDAPRGLTFGPDGNLYVAEQFNDSVRRYDGANGDFIDVFVPSGSGGLDRANDAVFGPDGELYVPSYNNNKVLRFDGGSGAFLDELPNALLNGPDWVTVGCRPGVADVPAAARPTVGLSVEPAWPNPCGGRATVGFALASPGRTRVTVLDVAGRAIATLLDRDLPSGRQTVTWDGRAADGRVAPGGLYFFRIEGGGARRGMRMLIVR